MLIRDATQGDDQAIADLLLSAFSSAYARFFSGYAPSPERLAELGATAARRAQGAVLVGEIDGKIVGTASLLRPGQPENEAWIAGAANLRMLAIDVAHQGRGLAQPLMTAAHERAKAWRANAVCLHVRTGAAGLARLYRSLGYLRDASGDLDLRPEVYLEAFRLDFRS